MLFGDEGDSEEDRDAPPRLSVYGLLDVAWTKTEAAMKSLSDTSTSMPKPGPGPGPGPVRRAQGDEARTRRVSQADGELDPLSMIPQPSLSGSDAAEEVSSLTLAEEIELVRALHKRKMSADCEDDVLYSTVVDVGKAGRLGMSVKELDETMLFVSSIRRNTDATLGPAEAAGIRLSDIIIGVNFVACRGEANGLIKTVEEKLRAGETRLEVQAVRLNSSTSDYPVPGISFPKRITNLYYQAFVLHKNKVLPLPNMWNFLDIMMEYVSASVDSHKPSAYLPQGGKSPTPQFDLERAILRANGLRPALDIRCVHTHMSNDTAVYVLRVEDVESGIQWQIKRRYREFYTLYQQLLDECPSLQDVPFPAKRLGAFKRSNRVVEERVLALERFLRQSILGLTLYSSMHAHYGRALKLIQYFLQVHMYLDPTHPPPMDDQRVVELLAYRLLNDPSSPAYIQVARFLDRVQLDALVTVGANGFKPVLQHVSDALNELQTFMMTQHSQQMTQALRKDSSDDRTQTFVRRCVRRQVEASLYLPLRRDIVRIVQSFVAYDARQLQRSMYKLQQASMSNFGVPEHIQQGKSWWDVIRLFQELAKTFLPADQGNLLKRTASMVMRLHSEAVNWNSSGSRMPNSPSSQNFVTGIGDIREGHRKVQDLLIDNLGERIHKPSEEANSNVLEKELQIQVEVSVSDSIPPQQSLTNEETYANSDPGVRESVIHFDSSTSRSSMGSEAHSRLSVVAEKMLARVRGSSPVEKVLDECPVDASCWSPGLQAASSDFCEAESFDETDSIEQIRTTVATASNEPLNDLLPEGPQKPSEAYLEAKVEVEVSVLSADDFLPLFTFVLIHAAPPHLLLVKEVMVSLVDDEETFGEYGYYLATLEAAAQHIKDLCQQMYPDVSSSTTDGKSQMAF